VSRLQGDRIFYVGESCDAVIVSGIFLIVVAYFIFCIVIIRCYTASLRHLIVKAYLNYSLNCDYIATLNSLICGMHQVFPFLAYNLIYLIHLKLRLQYFVSSVSYIRSDQIFKFGAKRLI
jgi:hypothetical protein